MRFVLIQFRYLELMMSSRCCDDNKLVIASFQEMCVCVCDIIPRKKQPGQFARNRVQLIEQTVRREGVGGTKCGAPSRLAYFSPIVQLNHTS